MRVHREVKLPITLPITHIYFFRISADGLNVETHTSCGIVVGSVVAQDAFAFRGIRYSVPVGRRYNDI